MRDSEKLKQRDDKITAEFLKLQKKEWCVQSICEELGKKYYLAPDTIRDIMYRDRESRRAKYKHGQRKDEEQLTVGNRQKKEYNKNI